MKNTTLLLLAQSAAALLLTSCSMTGDPRQGGIFWSEDKARVRQSSLNNELTYERGKTDTVRRHGDALSEEARARRAEESRLKGKISAVDSENAARTQDVEAKKSQIAALHDQISHLQAEMETLRADRSVPESDKQARLDGLKQEINQRKKQTAALRRGISR